MNLVSRTLLVVALTATSPVFAQSAADAYLKATKGLGDQITNPAADYGSCLLANNFIFNSANKYQGNRWGLRTATAAGPQSGCGLICQYMIDNKNNIQAIDMAIAQGKPKGCFAELTIRDFQPSFFSWYDREFAQLRADPPCSQYRKTADEIANSPRHAEADKKSALLRLFFEAQGKGCRA